MAPWCLQVRRSPRLPQCCREAPVTWPCPKPLSQGTAAGMPPFTSASRRLAQGAALRRCWSLGTPEPARSWAGRLGGTGGCRRPVQAGTGCLSCPACRVTLHAPRAQPAHALSTHTAGWRLSLGFPSSSPSCRHPRGNCSLCSASSCSHTAMGPWVPLLAARNQAVPWVLWMLSAYPAAGAGQGVP